MTRILTQAIALATFGMLWAVQAQTNTNALAPLTGPETALPDASVSVIRVFGGLIFVLSLFGVGIWMLRRAQQMGFKLGSAPRLRVVETRSLGYRHSLHVVAYDQQKFLIGTSPGTITLLSELPPTDPAATETPTAPPANFSTVLKNLLGRKS